MEPQRPQIPTHRATLRAFGAEPLQADPTIADYIKLYSKDKVKENVRTLSVADTTVTRNSYAIAPGVGGCQAGFNCANYYVNLVQAKVSDMFKEYNGEWEIETVKFRNDMCDNVRLVMRGKGGEGIDPAKDIVVTGAHLDSRNTNSGASATGSAPGADDNASGSAVIMEMARVIAENNINFQYSVHFLWFCGEEQGLLGSTYMANQYKDQGMNIIGMFNNDMIGYRVPSGPPTLSFMGRFATPWLSNSCKEFSRIYIPTLAVADTTVCCSDQQSFFNAGFPAAGIFETPTSGVVYPQYHQTGDSFDNANIDYDQVYLFGQANFVCMMEYALPTTSNS